MIQYIVGRSMTGRPTEDIEDSIWILSMNALFLDLGVGYSACSLSCV